MIAMSSRSLVQLSRLSAAASVAAGVSYLFVSPTELPVATLLIMGILGACALIAAGVWQSKAHSVRLSLTSLAMIAGLFVIASAGGIVGSGIARSIRLEPTSLPQILHAGGVLLGFLLCAGSLGALRLDMRHSHSEPEAGSQLA